MALSYTTAEVSNMLLYAFLAKLAYATAEGKTRAQQDAAWLAHGYVLHELIIDTVTDTHVSIASSDTEVVVAFKGTSDRVNMFQDANIRMVTWKGHLVHVGGLNAYQSVRAAVWAALLKLPPKPLKALGHSLGGMITTYFVFEWLNALGPDQGMAYTYGSPRVGSLAFSKAYNGLHALTNTYRIVHLDDIVPTVPFGGLYHHVTGFVHVGDAGAFVGPVTTWLRELVGIAKRCEGVLDLKDCKEHEIQNYIDALEKVVLKAAVA